MFHKCLFWFPQGASKSHGIGENDAYFFMSYQAWHSTLNIAGTERVFIENG